MNCHSSVHSAVVNMLMTDGHRFNKLQGAPQSRRHIPYQQESGANQYNRVMVSCIESITDEDATKEDKEKLKGSYPCNVRGLQDNMSVVRKLQSISTYTLI